MIRLLGVLAFASCCEVIGRNIPDDTLPQIITTDVLRMMSVVLFGATAWMAMSNVRGAKLASWAIIAAGACLIFTQGLRVTGHIPAFAEVIILGDEAPLNDFARDVTFVLGIALLTAGFYFLVFELIVAKHRVEADRERLSEEVEERKHVEAALHDSRERYSKIFASTEEGIVLLNESMQLVQFNPRFAELLGFRAGELTGMNALALFHPEDRGRVEEHHRKLVAGEPVARSYDFRMVDRRGRTHHISGSFDLIVRTDDFLCVHGILRDVTVLKQAEAAQLFRLKLESIVSTTSTHFMSRPTVAIDETIDDALRRVGEFAQADWAFVFQYEPGGSRMVRTHDWRAKGIHDSWDLLQALEEDQVPSFASAIRKGEAFLASALDQISGEELAEKAYLESQGIRTLCAVPMSFQSSVVGLLGVGYLQRESAVPEDVVGLLNTVGEICASALVRTRTEGALRKSEEKYRSILENIVEGYYEVDLEGNLTFFNESLCAILGYGAEELLGKNYRLYYPEDVSTEVFRVLLEVRDTGEPLEVAEWPIVRKDGSQGHVEVSCARVLDDVGRPVGFRGIMRDVTDRHEAEEERKQFEEQLRQTQKLESLGVLAGGVAHDFNNLLVAVLANAALAQEEAPPDSPALESLRQIELSAQRAADLANQMLTYSGKGNFIVQPTDLSEVVKEIAHLLQVSVSRKASLVCDLSESLPAVEGDPTQLRQVVMNLITNASEAIPGNEGTITIRTTSMYADESFMEGAAVSGEAAAGDYVVVEVQDNGCGMSEETRQRIFDPFYTSKFTGRGLGLATVMGIVRGHNGIIKVDSTEGVGTTFTVLFPASQESYRAEEPEPVAALENPTGGTLLVIDDEELIVDVAARVLERAGYDVLTAFDGLEGVEVFKAHADEIDVVLLDMTMPRMGGVETFLALTDIRPDLPVVLTSGFNEQEAATHFRDRKPSGFVQKPFRGADLLRKLHEILGASPVG